jgi:IS30 family transposase
MRKASKLDDAERSEIEILHGRGYSARSIASALGRSPNTVADELKRNSYENGRYVAARAKHKAYVRRKYAKYQGKRIQENNELRSFIVLRLGQHWNPAEISGYMKDHPELGFYASKTAIYEWLYSAWGQSYCQYLYSHRYHRKPRKSNKTNRVMIPDRIPVTKRPMAASDRVEVGHWEYDSVVSARQSHSTYVLAVAVERSTRYITAAIVRNLRPKLFAESIVSQLKHKRVATLTTDNGIENKQHGAITKHTGAAVYFTDPYSSWQKGSVENANKMLRRYFPKGTDFATIKQMDVVYALTLINNKPRKILGYKSSSQLAKEKGLILESVS